MNNIIESRNILIKLTDGTKIKGEVNLNRGNGYDRLSDLVGDYHENFLTVFNVALYDSCKNSPAEYRTLLVNKSHILYSVPEDDTA